MPQGLGFRIRTSDWTLLSGAPEDWAPGEDLTVVSARPNGAPALARLATAAADDAGSDRLVCGNSRAMREAASPSTTSQPCPVIFDIPTSPPSGPPGNGLKRISPASASSSQTARMRPGVTASRPPKFMSDVGTQPVLLSLN